jgi:hypothetical protein
VDLDLLNAAPAKQKEQKQLALTEKPDEPNEAVELRA